jgi:nucleoside-diphosphate-sugar epimerase
MTDLRDCRVAVIGATGFIGSHLTEKLMQCGADVLAVARSASQLSHLVGVLPGIRSSPADVSLRDSARGLFRSFRPQKVFHLASGRDGAETFDQMRNSLRQNTEVVINLLEISAEAKVDTFVYCDSSKVYGNTESPYTEVSPDEPICSYAIAKSAAWRYCKLYSGLSDGHVVALRPTMVYGLRQNVNLISHVLEQVRRKAPVVLQGGWQSRDPLFIDDAVQAFINAATAPAARNHAIPIGGGEEMTLTEICRRVAAAVGEEVEIVCEPDLVRPTEIFRSRCDNRDAERLLGWRPETSFEDGLARLVATPAASVRAASAGER